MASPSPPKASSPASSSHRSHRRTNEPNLNAFDHPLSEKAAYERNYPANIHTSSRSRDSVISHPFSPKASSPPSPSSISSAARHDQRRTTEIQEISHANVTCPPLAYLDPEKQSVSSHSPRSPRSPARVSASNPDVTATLYDREDDNDVILLEQKAVRLLIYLSGPCALLSFAVTFWAFVSLAIVILLSPIRLCSKRAPFRDQLIPFLAPPLNLQLAMVYSSPTATSYSTPMLLVIHIFSPFAAIGVAFAAWTAAFFWFFSAILGDPAGQDGHNDGRETILAVRNWWNRWLSRALR